MTRRIVGALLAGDPETADRPTRRQGLAMLASGMVAAMVFAGIAIYGLLVGGHTDAWRDGQSVIIERETGVRYVYRDRRLYPVLNYASARLVLGAGGGQAGSVSVSRRSLAGTPRGATIGIAGAPDALPDRSALLGLPWGVCSVGAATGTGQDPAPGATSRVTVGMPLPGGQALAAAGLLVTAGDVRYLIWHDRRLRLDAAALVALGMAALAPVPVTSAFLNGVEAGPDLTPPALPAGTGSPPPIGGTAYQPGQVFTSGAQFYVLVHDGLAAVHEVTAKLLLTGGGRAVEISPGAAAAALSSTRVEPSGLPETVPPLVRTDPRPAAVCAESRATGRSAVVTVFATAPQPLLDGGVPVAATDQDTADAVAVPGGCGALVQGVPSPGGTRSGTVYLVTDQGTKYALDSTSDVDAGTALGYEGVTPVGVPAGLLALVPTGPPLDPQAAGRTAPATSTPTATGPRKSS